MSVSTPTMSAAWGGPAPAAAASRPGLDKEPLGSAPVASLFSSLAGAVTRVDPAQFPPELAHPDLMLEFLKANIRPEAAYARVVKDGVVIATLDNAGGADTMNAYAGLFDVDGGPRQGGPALAQWRAEQIARATGGQIVVADTAQTPQTWKPSAPPSLESMRAYIAQRIAQESPADSLIAGTLDVSA